MHELVVGEKLFIIQFQSITVNLFVISFGVEQNLIIEIYGLSRTFVELIEILR